MTTPSKFINNGARAKILRALLKQGMLTNKEISDETGLTQRQVIDNASQARIAGLLKSGRDDVTQLMGYQITNDGRKWLETNAKPPAVVQDSLTTPDPVEIATAEESSVVAAEKAPAIDPSATDKESLIVAEPIEIDGNDSEWVPLDEQPESDRPTIQAAAEEPSAAAEDRDLYVVFGASMPVPEIAGPTLENAQQQCISLAFDSGTDLTLYRLVPVGQTRTSVTFVSQ